jgi:hypothetical protein
VIPEGADWSETQVMMNGTGYSFPLMRAAVRITQPSEDPIGESFYPFGPTGSFIITEVAIPNSTGTDLDLLMDQIVTLIDDFAQPFLSPGATTSTEKNFFRRPAEIIEGS